MVARWRGGFTRRRLAGLAAQAVADVHGYTIAFAVAAALFAAAGILCLLFLRADHTDHAGATGEPGPASA